MPRNQKTSINWRLSALPNTPLDRTGSNCTELIDAMTATSVQDRSFSCTFCHRKFTSAQALGGHMNLHRRERARLRTHFPASLFSDPLSSHRFWAFEQSLVYNKMTFDPSTMAFVTHQDVSSTDKFDTDEDHHRHHIVKRCAKFRRQLIQPSRDNSMVGGLDLELRLGQSLTYVNP